MTITGLLLKTGLRSGHLRVASVASVGACAVLWTRSKTVDQSKRDHAENRALFVGLWAPTLWLVADSLSQEE